MKKITLLAFLLIFTASFAQYDSTFINSESSLSGSGAWIVQKELNREIKGNYYLFDGNIRSGVITIRGGKQYQLNNLNYNIKDDRIESKITTDSTFVFDSRNIIQVDFDDVELRTLNNPKKSGLSFYEVIGSFNKKSLLMLHRIKLKEGIVNPMTQQKQTPDIFVKDTEYYIVDNGGKLEEFKLKKKTVLRFFNDNSDKVAQYVSEHDLSYKDGEDLKQVFKYYKSI